MSLNRLPNRNHNGDTLMRLFTLSRRNGSLAAAIALSMGFAPAAREPSADAVSVATLRTEYAVDPVGIDVRRPRLSWQLRSAGRDAVQSAYQLQVGTDSAALASTTDGALLWDSGRVASDASAQVEYAGPAPRSAPRYFWRVRVWDGGGHASPWSTQAYWETGLLSLSDWSAKWIEPAWPESDSLSQPSPLLRRSFTVRGAIRTARLYVTSHGLYEAQLNGTRVGDAVFAPGWTSYHKRLQYQTYDVTNALHRGANAIGVLLGDGWYRGRIGFSGQRNAYGKTLGLLLQLHISYADGSEDTIVSDSAWQAATGALRASDIYDGETYDARLEQPGWDGPGFNDNSWRAVRVAGVTAAADHLIGPVSHPGRQH